MNIQELRKEAEQGNADAQYELGKCYYYGFDVSVNKEEAVRWYRKAAEQGNADALRELVQCYYYGQGVPRSLAEAIRWDQKWRSC